MLHLGGFCLWQEGDWVLHPSTGTPGWPSPCTGSPSSPHALQCHPSHKPCHWTRVVSGLFAPRLSYYVSVAGLNLAPVLPILAGLGTFYPISPSRDLIILPHSSPGGHGDFQHSALPTRAYVTIPTKICLDADWDYAESVISLEKWHLYHRVSSES